MDTLIASYSDGTQVSTRPDFSIEPGHQVICITQTIVGTSLAFLLSPGPILLNGVWEIPHTSEVDKNLLGLIDLCAHLRITAPGLLQLSFTLEE